MVRSRALLEAIEAIYDAGTSPERWDDALGAVGRLVNAPAGALNLVRPSGFEAEFLFGMDLSTLGMMATMLDQNLWYQRRHLAPLNKAVVGEQIASGDEVKRTRVYSELLKPYDLLHMCGVAFLNQDGLFGAVNWMRHERKAPFGQSEIDLIDMVVPHIARATHISGLVQGINLYATGLEAVLDRLSFGLLLLDTTGRVIFANGEAERLLAAGRIVQNCGGRLAGATCAGSQRLDSFLDRLKVLREAAAVFLPEKDGPGLHMTGAPLPKRRRDFACLAAIAESMIFVFDAALERPPTIWLIAQLYGLTPAESRLAEALAAGKTLADYGEEASLSRNTLKTHLRALFDKTETTRQSDLVRKLSQLAALR